MAVRGPPLSPWSAAAREAPSPDSPPPALAPGATECGHPMTLTPVAGTDPSERLSEASGNLSPEVREDRRFAPRELPPH